MEKDETRLADFAPWRAREARLKGRASRCEDGIGLERKSEWRQAEPETLRGKGREFQALPEKKDKLNRRRCFLNLASSAGLLQQLLD